MGAVDTPDGHRASPGAIDDTELARRAIGGEQDAFGILFDRWLDRAFDVAWHILHDRDAAADATADAFAAAWQQIAMLRQPESFGGWLLRITRNQALTRLGRERRSRPIGAEETLVSLDPRRGEDPAAALTREGHGELVWAASAALGEEDASLLHLHLRHQLEPAELADELGVPANTAHQRLFRLRKRLGDAIGAWMLWRRGTPACEELVSVLDRLAADGFDQTMARAIIRHARDCDDCDERRSRQLRPEALFAALPLVLAGPQLRAQVIASLGEADVPVPSDDSASTRTTGPGSHDHSWARRAGVIGAGVVVLMTAIVVTVGLFATPAGDPEVDQVSIEGDSATQPTAPARPTATPPPTITTDDTATGPDTAEPEPPQTTPPPTGPPTTDPPITEPPVTEPQPDEPQILSFSAGRTDQRCGTSAAGDVLTEFSWETSGADAATLGPEAGESEAVAPSDTLARCAQPGATWELVATGPGGSHSDTVTVPSRAPDGPGDLTG